MTWACIILAGGTAPDDLVKAMGTPHRALASFGGRTCLDWVLDAVAEAGFDEIAVAADDAVLAHQDARAGHWVPSGKGAVDSARSAFEQVQADGYVVFPVDTPLIRPEDFVWFREEVERRHFGAGPFFATGICSASLFRERFPGTPATAIKLGGEGVLTGGLYATNRQGFELAENLLREFRALRKSPFKIVKRLGFGNLLAYATGRLDIERVEHVASSLLGGPTWVIPGASPASCMDFDNVAEYEGVMRVMRD